MGGPAPRVAGPGMAGAPCQRQCEVRKAWRGRQCRCGGPRGVEDRGGRGVERAMEECDAGRFRCRRGLPGAGARGSRDRA